MLFLLNGDGTMTRLDSGRIFQGSNNFTELGVIYPFSGVTLSVAFTLPDGRDTNYTIMPPLETYTMKGENDETKVFENLYYTSVRIPWSVTERQGEVKVTVLATSPYGVEIPDGEGGTTVEGRVAKCTSYAAAFTVEYAALPVYTVPEDPTEADFQKLVELLTAYQGTISGEVTELQTRMTTAESDIDTLQSDMTEAQGDISSLETRMTAAETDIDNLQSDMSTAQTDITSLKSRMTTAEGDIDTLQADMTTAKSDISSLKTRMTAAEESVEELQSDMTTAKANISALQSDMTEAQGDISSLETRMADAEDDISTAQSNITALQNDKQDKTDNSLDTADKTVVGAINEIYEELTQGGGVNSRLDTLEAEVDVIDSRVEDVEEKTAQPLMTDFTVDVDAATATKFYNNGDSSTIPLPAGGGTGGGGGVSTFSFAEATWVQQTDGTYTLTLTATQTGKSNNNYAALVAAADGTGLAILAVAVIINTDGSLYIEGVTTPFVGRVIIIG